MRYANKFAVATALSLLLAACGGGGSDSAPSATSAADLNLFSDTRFDFHSSRNSRTASEIAAGTEIPPYDINRYSGRIDSNQVVLSTNYTNVVGNAYSAFQNVPYRYLSEKRLIVSPIPQASPSGSYKEYIFVSATANSVTLAPYNEGLHKDTGAFTESYQKVDLGGKLIADVVTDRSFNVKIDDLNLKALRESGLKFPQGSDAFVLTGATYSEDHLFFDYVSMFKSIDAWKANNAGFEILFPTNGKYSYREFVWLGINFTCAVLSERIDGDLTGCLITYEGQLYLGNYNVKGPDPYHSDFDRDYGLHYRGFNKTAADALESALKTHFTTRINPPNPD